MVDTISSLPLSTQAVVDGSSIGTCCVGGAHVLTETVVAAPACSAAESPLIWRYS